MVLLGEIQLVPEYARPYVYSVHQLIHNNYIHNIDVENGKFWN